MKIRKSFITNSSSSSFIINKKDGITKEKIIHILKEYIKDNNGLTSIDEAKYDAYFEILDSEIVNKEDLVEWFPDMYYDKMDEISFEKYFIVNNDPAMIKIDREILEKVLDKTNIDWFYGYCD